MVIVDDHDDARGLRVVTDYEQQENLARERKAVAG